MSFQLQIQQFAQRLADLLSIANLQLWLLVGSGLLAVSLLTLALTRWGHSRPVWKCVILSFVAHILLMGYGYATYLIAEKPTAVAVAEPVRVNLVEDSGKTLMENPLACDDVADQPAEKNSWDRLPDHAIDSPEQEPLDRPLIDSELVVKSVRPEFDRLDDGDGSIQPEDLMAALSDSSLPVDEISEQIDLLRASRSPRNTSSETVPDLTSGWDVSAQEIEVSRHGDDPRESELAAPTKLNDVLPELERPKFDQLTADPLAHFRESMVMPNADDEKAPLAGELVSPDATTAMGGIGRQKLIELESPLAQREIEHAQPRIASQGRIRVLPNPRRLGDGAAMPHIYSLRTSDQRLEVAQSRGGSIRTERAVENGLQWLADHQQPDGRWDARQSGAGRETRTFGHDRNNAGADADTGITSLATLAFLAAGHSHFEGRYQRNVQLALEYLASQQGRDGNLAGDAKMFARMYCHSMTLLAFSEALAMTGDDRLLPVVQRAVDYSLDAQNKQDGGWRYQPGDAGDMSQFGWMALALNSARLGGAHIPADTFDRMMRFIDACSSGPGKGLAAYRPGQGPTTSMTAEALLCRYLLNHGVSDEARSAAAERVGQELPSQRKVNLYYWYYGTLALRHVGGPAWERWNDRLKSTLVALQTTSGADAGSWEPDGVWGGYGGRVYSTAMATLNLEVYYRYLPSHEMPDSVAHDSFDGSVRR